MPEAANLVTSENREAYMAARMAKPAAAPAPAAVVDNKAPATEEKSPVVESGQDKPVPRETTEHPEGEHGKKNGIPQRFSELSHARREAERVRDEAIARAQRAEAELEALKKPAKPNGKPEAANFKDAFEYAEALADWKVQEKLRERDEADRQAKIRAESERLGREWNAKAKAAAREIDDYEEVMAEAALPVTRDMTIALLQSDIGPHIQYFFAKNPDELDRLQKMTVDGMLKAFGRLEAKLEGDIERARADAKKAKEGEKPAGKTEEKPAEPAARPRKAQEPPEPITPIAGSGLAGAQAIVDANGNVTGSYADYKQARKAGKIR